MTYISHVKHVLMKAMTEHDAGHFKNGHLVRVFDDIDKMSKHSSCLEMFRLVDQGSDWAKKSMNALSSLKNSFKDEMES